MSRVDKLEALQDVLVEVWSVQSSTKWTPDNPALGQCSVTSLVVNDLFGGEILKTSTPGGWHFYNQIDGQRNDLTAMQFTHPLQYADILSSRKEAFMDTNEEQYNDLKQRVLKSLVQK